MVASKGAGFQRRYLHSGRIRGGVTQLPGDATAVIGCWTWVKRAFILPILSKAPQIPARCFCNFTRTWAESVQDFLASDR